MISKLDFHLKFHRDLQIERQVWVLLTKNLLTAG